MRERLACCLGHQAIEAPRRGKRTPRRLGCAHGACRAPWACAHRRLLRSPGRRVPWGAARPIRRRGGVSGRAPWPARPRASALGRAEGAQDRAVVQVPGREAARGHGDRDTGEEQARERREPQILLAALERHAQRRPGVAHAHELDRLVRPCFDEAAVAGDGLWLAGHEQSITHPAPRRDEPGGRDIRAIKGVVVIYFGASTCLGRRPHCRCPTRLPSMVSTCSRNRSLPSG